MKKLIAKKVSDLLNSTVKVGSTEDVPVEPAKWFVGSIEVPQDKKSDK